MNSARLEVVEMTKIRVERGQGTTPHAVSKLEYRVYVCVVCVCLSVGVLYVCEIKEI